MTIPKSVYLLCMHGGLITGSRALKMAGLIDDDLSNSDWDIMVPYEKWQTVALLWPKSVKRLTFGGWTYKDAEGNDVDVWPDTLFNYLSRAKNKRHDDVIAIDYINNRVFTASSQKLVGD